VAGCNLGLLMRTLFGLGTPRGLQDLARAILDSAGQLLAGLRYLRKAVGHAMRVPWARNPIAHAA
jgi:hypothetical protein